MQTLSSKTPVPRLMAASRFVLAALVQRGDTADLAPPLQVVLDLLSAAVAGSAAASDATIPARVTLRFSERRLESVIRTLANDARNLDHGKAGGRVASTLFPDGLNAVVIPETSEQHAVATQLLHRLVANEVAAPLRAVHEPALTTSLADLRHAIDARDASVNAYDAAFQQELAARDALVRAYESVAHAVQSRFPKDRPQQEMFFETLRPRDAKADAPSTPTPPAQT